MMNKRLVIFAMLLACGWIASVQAASNNDFGRLFSRPNERANLDILRQNQKLKVVTPNPVDSEIESAPIELPAPITLQGYVKRSDGSKSTLWINNQPVQEDSSVDNVKIGRLNKNGTSGQEGLDVKIPANGKNVRLKAGQVYEPETNQLRELKTIEKEKQLNLEETGAIEDSENVR
ncbi:MAG TPA: hypothetical protein VK949_02160 [Methylotenera sp.]|nr:hypothetical protein [Methylotenera sp.]